MVQMYSLDHAASLAYAGGPVPEKQSRDARDGMIIDPLQHVGEPSLRLDFIELGRRNH